MKKKLAIYLTTTHVSLIVVGIVFLLLLLFPSVSHSQNGMATATPGLFIPTATPTPFVPTATPTPIPVGCTAPPWSAGNTMQLNDAIFCYNQSMAVSGVINITTGFTLNAPTTPINNTTGASLTIAGNGHSIDGADSYRHFTIASSDVTIANITLQNGNDPSTECWGGSCGGAVKVESAAVFTLTHTTILSSTARLGGGIVNFGGTANVTTSTLSSNSTTIDGGAIYIFNGDTNVSNSTLSGNLATSDGAAIYNNGGTATVSNSTLSANSATSEGGAIFNAGTTTVTNSTLSANSAIQNGGAIFNHRDGRTTVSNSTLSGNSAIQSGGGIFNNNDGTVNIKHSTIADNSAVTGAGVSSVGDDLTFTNIESSTIAGNIVSPANGTNAELQLIAGTTDSFKSSGYNVVGSVGANVMITGTADITDTAAADLLIAPLADNSCVTKHAVPIAVDPSGEACVQTHALLAGSPAIDRPITSTVAADQRDVPTFNNVRDSGAFEYVYDCDVSPWPVANTAELNGAIGCYNLEVGNSHLISVTGDITLTSATSAITNTTSASLTIAGNNHTINGNNSHRIFTVASSDVTINSIVLQSGKAAADCPTANGSGGDNGSGFDRCGGAIKISSPATVIVNNSTLLNNRATNNASGGLPNGGKGGGIFNEGSVTVNNSTFFDNYGFATGGGVFNTGTAILSTTTFDSNGTFGSGGGLYNAGATTVSNSTVTNNRATNGAGGIYNQMGTISIINTTISENDGGFDQAVADGLQNNVDGVITVANSIIANGVEGRDCINAGTITFTGRNIVESEAHDCGLDQQNIDPVLATLSDNGCVTTHTTVTGLACVQTHKLLLGSPAIDKGDSDICSNAPISNLDQRGVSRAASNAPCDIGAYEAVAGSIILEKITIPAGATQSFSFTGSITSTLSHGLTSTHPATPGVYTITETAQSGWDLSSLSCDGDSITNINTASAIITITTGIGTATPLPVTCTYTNTQRGSLVVQKTLPNNNGGTASCADFSFTVGGTSYAFEADCSNTVFLPAGNYTVTENALPIAGYATTYANCSNVTLTSGGTTTCTITNDDQPATLTVTKVVSNTNGGTASCGDFAFTVAGVSHDFEADCSNEIALPAGSYTVTENAVTGYAATYNNCSNVALANGGAATCTITNNDVAPILTLQKVVINDNVGTAKAADFTLHATGLGGFTGSVAISDTLAAISSTVQISTSYTLTETGPIDLYMASEWICTAGGVIDTSNGFAIQLPLGADVTCTITNNDRDVSAVSVAQLSTTASSRLPIVLFVMALAFVTVYSIWRPAADQREMRKPNC